MLTELRKRLLRKRLRVLGLAGRARSAPGLGGGHLEEKRVGLWVPPASNLHGSKQKLAPSAASKLWVLPEFSAPGHPKSNTVLRGGTIYGKATCPTRGRCGSIDGNLRAMVHRDAIGYNLDAPTILGSSAG